MFDSCVAPLEYAFPVSTMLQRVKYNRQIVYARPLVKHLINNLQKDYCDKPWPEALIPVPLHWWKLRKRGFNQAGVIAEQLSKAIDIPVYHHLVKRRNNDQSQQGLSANKRKQNMQNAFALRKPVPYKHVAVVDDVMTTGATTEELCKVLKKHGVETVDVWCVARTPSV
ncbi:ComF family protein [Parendozoicomonas sp. Alg238-R29]|uniref:ComF family protein n=1 Tax=Parendozoicomonas sp. Alg238-R29 TaxID=2993446 RepID=UPI00248D9174|nr:ComF family protein [Parendozoicomonas sp. Alg238-R29]